MVVTSAPIRLHIDRLVVDGAPVADPSGLGRAVEAELTRLLTADHGRLGDGGVTFVERLDAGPMAWSDDGASDAVGRRLAAVVHGSLGGGRS